MNALTRALLVVPLLLAVGVALLLFGQDLDPITEGAKPGASRGARIAPVRSDVAAQESDTNPSAIASTTKVREAGLAPEFVGSLRGERLERLLGRTFTEPRRVRVEWSGTVRAIVRLPDGSPAVGVDVSVKGYGDPRGQTDALGVVVLECSFVKSVSVEPGAEPKRSGFSNYVGVLARTEWAESFGSAWRSNVHVKQDATTHVGLQLQPSYKVVMEVDRALSDTESRVYGPGRMGERTQRWESPTRGTFVAEAAGTYRVYLVGRELDSDTWAWAEGQVEVGSAARARLPLRVQSLAGLDVRLEDPHGKQCLGWLRVTPLEARGEWGLKHFTDQPQGLGVDFGSSPFAEAVRWKPGEGVRVNLPPGRWLLTAVGVDPGTAPVERELTLAPGSMRAETLRLEASASTRVQLPAAAIGDEQGQLKLFLHGPAGISLGLAEGGVEVRGLAAGERARVVVTHTSAAGNTAAGALELRGGTDANVSLQRPGGLAGHVAESRIEDLRLQLVYAEGPVFSHSFECDYQDLLAEAEERERDLRDRAEFGDEEGDEEDPYDTGVNYALPRDTGARFDFVENVSLQGLIEANVKSTAGGRFEFEDPDAELGDYSFGELIPGRYSLTFHDGDTGEVLAGPDVTIPGGRVHRLDLVVPPR